MGFASGGAMGVGMMGLTNGPDCRPPPPPHTNLLHMAGNCYSLFYVCVCVYVCAFFNRIVFILYYTAQN
jgi:hypothetical protein